MNLPSKSSHAGPQNAQPDKSKQSHDDAFYTSWCTGIGAVLGLLLTVFVGHWASNAALVGLVGFVVGAMIDRARR